MPRYVDADKIGSFMLCSTPDDEYAIGWNEAIAKIETSAPTADVEPIVHAHWIHRFCDHRNDYYDVLAYPYICSACRGKNKEATKRCPDCGARMDEEE